MYAYVVSNYRLSRDRTAVVLLSCFLVFPMFLADLDVPYSLIAQSVSSLCCDRSLVSLSLCFLFRTYLIPLFTVTYSSYGDCFSLNLSAVFVHFVLFSCTFRAEPAVQPPNCHPRLSAAAERCPRRARRSTRVNRYQIDLASDCEFIERLCT